MFDEPPLLIVLYKKSIKYGFIAQSVEQRIENPRVLGSIPSEATSIITPPDFFRRGYYTGGQCQPFRKYGWGSTAS